MSKFEFPFPRETRTLDESTRANLPGSFIELPAGFTHYQFAGPEQAPLVVLVHGFSAPYFIWEPTFIGLLSLGFRLLRYDLYGRGFSDRPYVRYDASLFVKQLADLLDALQIKKPVNLLGLSMGGVVATQFCLDHPSRVTRLGLIDPAGFPLRYSLPFKLLFRHGLGEILLALRGNQDLIDSIASDFYEPKHIKQFIDQYRPQMEFKGFKRALLSTLRSGILEKGLPVYQRLGHTDLPVLLLWGEQDHTVPFMHSAELVSAIPQLQFHPIPDTGHIPHYEKAEIVTPILAEFLRAPAG